MVRESSKILIMFQRMRSNSTWHRFLHSCLRQRRMVLRWRMWNCNCQRNQLDGGSKILKPTMPGQSQVSTPFKQSKDLSTRWIRSPLDTMSENRELKSIGLCKRIKSSLRCLCLRSFRHQLDQLRSHQQYLRLNSFMRQTTGGSVGSRPFLIV